MFHVQSFWLFIVSSLILLLIPGPAVIYVMTRSVDQGRHAGLVFVFGVELGNLVLAIAAAVGLAAIIVSSDVAFSIVRYLGAAYLIYLGIKRILSKGVDTVVTVEHTRLIKIFTQGIIVAVFNPKTALFFLAFLPQFVEISRGGVWEQTLLLGLTFTLLGLLTDSIYALLASTVGNWLKRRGGFQRGQRYASGGTYLMLGMIAAVSGHGKN